MHITLKTAVDHWAKSAKEDVAKTEQQIRNLQADLKLAQENHARLVAELAVYEAKKETF